MFKLNIDMNFVKNENMPQRQFRPMTRDMQYGNSAPQAIANSNGIRNRRFLPALMQTRPPSNQMSSGQNWTSATQIRPRTPQSVNVVPMHRGGPTMEQSACAHRNMQNAESPATVNTHAAVYRSNTSSSHNQSYDAYLPVETGRRIGQSFGAPEVDVQANTPLPIPKKRLNTTINSESGSVSNEVTKMGDVNAAGNNLNIKMFGNNDSDKIFIFTGTVERVIKWNKIFCNHFCYFEVLASVISIQEGSVKTQKIMLLRDKKGPILQVVYYTSTHIDIEDFQIGQILRCVGNMSAPNILNAVSIRSATQEEIETLQRLCLICDQAVSHFLNA